MSSLVGCCNIHFWVANLFGCIHFPGRAIHIIVVGSPVVCTKLREILGRGQCNVISNEEVMKSQEECLLKNQMYHPAREYLIYLFRNFNRGLTTNPKKLSKSLEVKNQIPRKVWISMVTLALGKML